MIYHIFYEWLFKTLSAGGGGESYFVKASRGVGLEVVAEALAGAEAGL